MAEASSIMVLSVSAEEDDVNPFAQGLRMDLQRFFFSCMKFRKMEWIRRMKKVVGRIAPPELVSHTRLCSLINQFLESLK